MSLIVLHVLGLVVASFVLLSALLSRPPLSL